MSVADRTTRAQPASRGGLLTRLLAERRTLVMGVLNVTPDSFSDGGRFLDPANAITQAERLAAEGADLIDVGAESSRPYVGAVPTSLDDELARLAPVLPAVIGLGVPVSIDTMKAKVAAWAVDAGAVIVNDVWGLQHDPDMAKVVAELGTPLVIMHNREQADGAIDIMADIEAFFVRSLDIAVHAGIPRDRIVLDPGIGFGKTPLQSMVAIAQLARLKAFGMPLLVGASRKRFIDSVSPAPPDRRLGGSIAAHLLAVDNGAAIVRVHDVGATVQALRVTAAIRDVR
jgi:dihydropteroate synthase